MRCLTELTSWFMSSDTIHIAPDTGAERKEKRMAKKRKAAKKKTVKRKTAKKATKKKTAKKKKR